MDLLAIFTQMSWVAAILLIVGVVLIGIEAFVPGFGFFGVGGTVSLIAGIIVRICQGLNVEQSMAFILLCLAVFIVFGLIFVFSARFGLFGRNLFEKSSTLDKNYNVPERKIKKLVGKSGKAITDINLGGKAKIRGKIYDVQSLSSFIETGSNIKVVDIKNNILVVRKWFE
ncbi:MAG: hypothetical protein IKM43_00655 [Clostridia bacterium]|nr:hypothetical protein [Clostridia bacterium]